MKYTRTALDELRGRPRVFVQSCLPEPTLPTAHSTLMTSFSFGLIAEVRDGWAGRSLGRLNSKVITRGGRPLRVALLSVPQRAPALEPLRLEPLVHESPALVVAVM